MFDKNILLENFSSSMGNSENKFIKYSIDNSIINYKELIIEFTDLQNLVYNYIYKLTEPNKQLTSREIETISENFCRENVSWIDTKGLIALNHWLIWMCWHEGILKKE